MSVGGGQPRERSRGGDMPSNGPRRMVYPHPALFSEAHSCPEENRYVSSSDSYHELECGGLWELHVFADEHQYRWHDVLKKVPMLGKDF